MNGKRRQPIRSGTLTILITCVLILLAVLALLSLTTAHADEALASRQMVYAQQNALSERVGQEWLAAMDEYLRAGGILPDGTKKDGDQYSVSLLFAEDETLDIAAKADKGGKLRILKWEITVIRETESTYFPDGVEPVTEPSNGIYDLLPETSAEGSGLA